MNAPAAHVSHNSLFGNAAAGSWNSTLDRVMQSLRSVATLSEALRILGAGVLLASMSLYLLQGWNAGNDINRYLLLLAQTGLLAMAGFAMSHGLREPKGARVFFGLALVSIPANFTILGALLYSVFQWDGALTTYPAFATWRIDDAASTSITIAAALLVLLPVMSFCFAIMARHSAKRLTVHFLVLNLLLLIPVRSSMVAGTIALLGIGYAVSVTRGLMRDDAALTTAEGRFALGTMYIPMGIMLGRSLYFYDVDSLIIAMLATATFAALRQASVFPDRSPTLATTLDAAALPVAGVAALALGHACSNALTIGLVAPLSAVTFAMFGLDILRRTPATALRRFVAVAVCIVLASGFTIGVGIEPSAITAALALLTGSALVVAGSWTRYRTAVLTGSATMIAGIWFGFQPLLDLVLVSNWISLAVIGAIIIALASVLERHGAALTHRARRWIASYAQTGREIAPGD